jgi:hypothetical protein
MDDHVFIILRHVNSESTDRYWKECYDSIRKFYPDIKIIIIDDNSSVQPSSHNLINCEVIQSEYPKRAEILPYYYFHKYKPAQKAIILHDSVFINSHIDVTDLTTFRFLWDFEEPPNLNAEIFEILSECSNNLPKKLKYRLLNLYIDRNQWKGCFGAMTAINWDFINRVNIIYNFFNITLDRIKTRDSRMSFERIIACIFIFENNSQYLPSYFGNIYDWHLDVKGVREFSLKYDEYIKSKETFKKYPIIKVWTCR